jgi:hypothetical protein
MWSEGNLEAQSVTLAEVASQEAGQYGNRRSHASVQTVDARSPELKGRPR